MVASNDFALKRAIAKFLLRTLRLPISFVTSDSLVVPTRNPQKGRVLLCRSPAGRAKRVLPAPPNGAASSSIHRQNRRVVCLALPPRRNQTSPLRHMIFGSGRWCPLRSLDVPFSLFSPGSSLRPNSIGRSDVLGRYLDTGSSDSVDSDGTTGPLGRDYAFCTIYAALYYRHPGKPPGSPALATPREHMKGLRTRVSKNGHAKANLFHVLIQVKLIGLEIAATIVFFVWLYRELIHELHR